MVKREASNVRRDRLKRHKLSLGLFASNVSSGRVVSRLPERWPGTWQDNLTLARLADIGGIDFILPIARWKGYGGISGYEKESLETITWATGILANTSRLTVFGTVHVPLFHPVAAAKQMVTADHIGGGRFGLNVVCGWNQDEFSMFGTDVKDHSSRYAYAQEWLDIIRKIWQCSEDFDYLGEHFSLKRVIGEPKPFGGTAPILMNAGMSPTGRAFALRNCELFFTTENSAKEIKAIAQGQGRDVDVLVVASITCRQTQREAEDFFRYSRIENADWDAVDEMLLSRVKSGVRSQIEVEQMRMQAVSGYGSLSFVGCPDHVAQQIASLYHAGIDGVGLEFFHYVDELPFFIAEVIPRLERMGVRA